MCSKKYFIMTDERTGGTCFVGMFGCCNLTRIHDPQTRTYEKFGTNFERIEDLMDCSFRNFDVVKMCYFNIELNVYKSILNYCIKRKINIIVLHRDDIYKRAQSKCVADALNTYNVFDTSKHYSKFSIDLNLYKKYLLHYNNHIEQLIRHLNENKYYYFFVTYEDIYTQRNTIQKLFAKLNLQVTKVPVLENLLNKDYKTEKKNELILNKDQLEIINSTTQKPRLNLQYKFDLD